MKSIQTKFIFLMLGCVLLSSLVIGGAGVLNFKRAVDEESAQILNLHCAQKAEELDAVFYRIEQSVGTLAAYALDKLDSVERLKGDSTYEKKYTKKLEEVAVNAAANTEGAISVYIRYNPEFSSPVSGLFWSRETPKGRFQRLIPTDFSLYSADDTEHVGWYYIPVKKGRATWMEPYQNRNINAYIISYVIPIFKNNETVGVVGMDIDFSLVSDIVAGMSVYDTGYAFLVDEGGVVMYHREIESGIPMVGVDASLSEVVDELKNKTSGTSLYSYHYRGHKKQMAFRSLANGMQLALTAPVSEIDRTKTWLILQVAIAALLISGIAILAGVLFTRRLIRPLRELNEAAEKISAGDLSISICCKSRDEVGTLAASFQRTVEHLRNYIDYINGLAYRDGLTGVKNKMAWQDAVRRLEQQMNVCRPEFAVVVMDINGLKKVNDTCGHDFGDMLILASCRLICKTFRHSPVYRIGGDEFAVILENSDLEHYQELLQEFEEKIREHNRKERPDNHVSIARGIAVYDSETDLVFNSVFKRADGAMYENKAMMKRGILAGERAESDAGKAD